MARVKEYATRRQRTLFSETGLRFYKYLICYIVGERDCFYSSVRWFYRLSNQTPHHHATSEEFDLQQAIFFQSLSGRLKRNRITFASHFERSSGKTRRARQHFTIHALISVSIQTVFAIPKWHEKSSYFYLSFTLNVNELGPGRLISS